MRTTRAIATLAALAGMSLAQAGDIALEQQQLLASDGLDEDQFGGAVAIDGNYAIVGALGVDRSTNLEGAAYIFRQTSTGWEEDDIIQSDVIAEGDWFGADVDISGTRAIIGAPFHNDLGFNTGAAYIFEREGGQWVQKKKIVAADRNDIDQFGQAVAIDGDTVIIGSARDDDNGNDSGSAYVFVFENNDWVLEDKLTPMDGADTDWFGRAVDIDGDTAVIGARASQPPKRTGIAYVFERNAGSWSEDDQLMPDDLMTDDRFGGAVAIQGDSILIGAWNHQHDPSGGVGSAYEFVRGASGWVQQGELFGPEALYAGQITVDGSSVAIDGPRAIVGNQLYKKYGSTWRREREFELLMPLGTDQLGRDGAVALDGSTALLGERLHPLNGSDWGPGSAWLFSISLGEVVTVPDLNGNGAPELAVPMAGSARVHVRDGSSGDVLSDIDYGDIIPHALRLVDDYNASTKPELALLGTGQSGTVRVEVKDSQSGVDVNTIFYGGVFKAVDMTLLPDSNTNGVDELVVLGEKYDGATRAQARDIVTDAVTHTSYYGIKGPSRDVAVIDDVSGNSEPEVAVSQEIPVSGQSRLQLRDTDLNNVLSNMFFGTVYLPVDAVAIGDVSGDGVQDLAALGRRPDSGAVRVQVKDTDSGTTWSNAYLGATDTPISLIGIEDTGGTAAPDIAVLMERPDGSAKVVIRDGGNGAFIRNLFFGAINKPVALSVMDDYDTSGDSEIAVLGDDGAGTRRVQVRDSISADLVNIVDFP